MTKYFSRKPTILTSKIMIINIIEPESICKLTRFSGFDIDSIPVQTLTSTGMSLGIPPITLRMA